MLKTVLTVTAAAVALLAGNAYAQSDVPGEGRAATSKPATKEEKAEARKKRQATSKEIAHGKGSLDSDNTVRDRKKATPEEKAAGKTSRKAAGTEAAKEGSGRLEEGEGKK